MSHYLYNVVHCINNVVGVYAYAYMHAYTYIRTFTHPIIVHMCPSATFILPVGYHIYSILYVRPYVGTYVCVCAVCTMCVYVMLVHCVLCQCISSCRECSMATLLSSESPTPGGGGNQMSWQGERSKMVVLLCTASSVLLGLLQ